MPRQTINDLLAFRAVARARSFTRAAAQIGVSPSALSHRIRALEEGLGIRLLTRTTRSVAPTEAGERLLTSIGPHFDGIEAELAALSELRDKPAGTIRITAGDHVSQSILEPAVARLLRDYPDIQVEISVNLSENGRMGDAGVFDPDAVLADSEEMSGSASAVTDRV